MAMVLRTFWSQVVTLIRQAENSKSQEQYKLSDLDMSPDNLNIVPKGGSSQFSYTPVVDIENNPETRTPKNESLLSHGWGHLE